MKIAATQDECVEAYLRFLSNASFSFKTD